MTGGRLREVHARIKELSTEEVEHRVVHILLRLVTQSARHTDDGVLVDFPITQQDLGEASGTTLHSVSRVLGAWEHTGASSPPAAAGSWSEMLRPFPSS
jgi:CRP-like cAMP-binding protein